jgi:hypothetical protein
MNSVMNTDNNFPYNEEEGQKASSRDPQDDTLGSAELNDVEQNAQAGEMEAVDRATEAARPSYELNLDSGDFAGGIAGETPGDSEDSNLKQ